MASLGLRSALFAPLYKDVRTALAEMQAAGELKELEELTAQSRLLLFVYDASSGSDILVTADAAYTVREV
ncbi:hypothetical protein [Treponema endosymbiont of Eucomonympha sp.]|uniref:hypothetical protein n=1 Tax=Treponema endosymbiont of Eucomonympha sp. TaxID=1580831 RepID=UPI0007506FDD|nr:hypothetical protein [Treponema endosymbiont of Eucomonympha sp.]